MDIIAAMKTVRHISPKVSAPEMRKRSPLERLMSSQPVRRVDERKKAFLSFFVQFCVESHKLGGTRARPSKPPPPRNNRK